MSIGEVHPRPSAIFPVAYFLLFHINKKWKNGNIKENERIKNETKGTNETYVRRVVSLAQVDTRNSTIKEEQGEALTATRNNSLAMCGWRRG